jgi:hypothetical protein
MNDRLDQLCFLPPPADTPWSGPPSEPERRAIKRNDGQTIEFDAPLFWYDPPWHDVSADAADVIATAVAELGVLVSALRRDLSDGDGEPGFHVTEREQSEQDDDAGDSEDAFEPLPRIVPYRPERYGLSDRDFDAARIIDVRLLMARDPSGRFAYSPRQIQRWEATPADEPLAGGGWIPSATFPPDVASMQHLSSKLSQLRALSPTAAVFVSMGPHRLNKELPEIIANKPEGLILRLDELPLDGLQLASVTRHARQVIDQAGGEEFPLWVVPGEITPDDAVKLIACGASAVAIDEWCNSIIEEVVGDSRQSSSYGSSRISEAYVDELIEESLSVRIERFNGLSHSLRAMPKDQQMATLNSKWAKALGVPFLSLTGKASRAKPAKH